MNRGSNGRFISLDRKPLCHPDRRYFARDLCANCYKNRQAARALYKSQIAWKLKNPARNHKKRIEDQLRKKLQEEMTIRALSAEERATVQIAAR